MALTERLALLVSLDAGGAIKGLESVGRAADRNLGKTESKLDKMGQRFQKAGAGMLAGAGLAAAGLYQAGKSAADLEQAVGGTEAVFKDVSGVIDSFAKTSAKNMGLSERAFREATTSIGGQLKGLGFSVDDSADKAIELTGVAADLAATYGGTTAEAVQALGAAFRGEADPAERFNLFLNQNRVNAEAVALGLAKSTSSVSANAKAQATLSLITKQSADAQGQFARETGTAAGQMQIASAEFENARAALGQSVAPVMAEVAGRLADLAGGFTAANEASGGLVSKLATFGTIGLGAAGGLSFLAGKAIQLRDSIKDIPSRVGDLVQGLGRLKGPAAIAAGGVGLFALAMFKAKERADDLRAAAQELRNEAESTGKTLEDVALNKLVKSFAESDQVTAAMDALGVSFEDLRGPLQGSAADYERWAAELNAADVAATGNANSASVLRGRVKQLRGELAEAEQVTGRTAQANRALGIATDDAAAGQDSAADSVRGLNGALAEQPQFIKDVEKAVADARSTLAGRVSAQSSYARSVLATNDALEGLRGSGGRAGGSVKDFTKDIKSAQKAVDDARMSLTEAQAALDEARRPSSAGDTERGQINVSQARVAAERAARRVTDAERALVEARSTGGDVRQAELDLEDARLDAREAVFSVSDAEEALQQIREKGTATDKRVIEAQDRVEDAAERVTEAQERQIEVQKQSTEAAGGGASSQSDLAQAMLNAKDKAVDEAEALAELRIKTREANGETLTAAEKTRIFDRALGEVAGRLQPGSPLRTHIEQYRTDLSRIQREVGTKILVDAGGSFDTVQNLLAYLDAIGNVGPHAVLGATSLLEFKQKRLLEFEGRAHGGSVTGGSPYIVGERGPELFMPDRSGTIIPNGNLGGGGGGSQTIVVQIGTTEIGRVFVEAARQYERSNGTSWRN